MGHPVGKRPPSRRHCRGSIHQRYDRATELGGHGRGQLTRFWRSAVSGVEQAVKRGENDQHAKGRAGERGRQKHRARTAVGLWTTRQGGHRMQVPVPCLHGWLVYTRRMLERADRTARGPIYKVEVLRRVPLQVGGGKPTPSAGGPC